MANDPSQPSGAVTESWLQKRFGRKGVTLVEGVIAIGLAAAMISTAAIVQGHHTTTLRAIRETQAATYVNEERIEQLRTANWRDATDDVWLQGQLNKKPRASAGVVEGMTETITVNVEPADSGTAIKVQKVPKSAAATLSDRSMSGKTLARIVHTVEWTGAGNRKMRRESTVLLAQRGVNRLNVPYVNSNAPSDGPEPGGGSPWATPVATTDPSASPSATTDGGGQGNGSGSGNNESPSPTATATATATASATATATPSSPGNSGNNPGNRGNSGNPAGNGNGNGSGS